MARTGDKKTRSDCRVRSHKVSVRLSPEEWETLSAQAEEWNAQLSPKASKAARMTIPRLMRTAALRRKRPPAVVAVGIPAQAVTELKALRSDMARLGNLLKTWMEYGDGTFQGKGQELKIVRSPFSGEMRSVRDLLDVLNSATETITQKATQLGAIPQAGEDL